MEDPLQLEDLLMAHEYRHVILTRSIVTHIIATRIIVTRIIFGGVLLGGHAVNQNGHTASVQGARTLGAAHG